jgi:hypothetical protein
VAAALAGALVALAGCSSAPGSVPAAPPDPAGDGTLRILFLGNSHTSRHDVPGTVAALLRAARPGARVEVVREPTLLHLQERAEHGPSLELLGSQPWDYVVLQAQDYSSSGRYDYPTTGAEQLVRQARAAGAVPVLFAEWARRGVDETRRIVDTYARVAAADPACLPPVPEAFDRAGTDLLAADGNHASTAGAFLAATVLAGALVAEPVAGLPAVDGPPAMVQRRLRQVADAALAAVGQARACEVRW